MLHPLLEAKLKVFWLPCPPTILPPFLPCHPHLTSGVNTLACYFFQNQNIFNSLPGGCGTYIQPSASLLMIFKKILFIHNRHRERERKRKRERERDRQREKQASCREPDMGLDPRSTGSRPGPKAGAKPLSHPGIPKDFF